MKKSLTNFLLLTSLSPFLVNCASSGQDINRLDLQVRNLNSQRAQLEQKIEQLNKQNAGYDVGAQVAKSLQQQAAMSDTIDKLNNEMLQIRGQVEESTHANQRLQKENKDLRAHMDAKLDKMADQIILLTDQLGQAAAKMTDVNKGREMQDTADRVKASEERSKAENQAREAERLAKEKETERLLAEGNQKGAKTATTPESKKGATPAKSETSSAKEDDGHYNEGIALFQEKKYKQAYTMFADFLTKYPKSEKAANARFWLGDCYYNQNEYELAILEYQKVIADYPTHGKAPAALLKQGLAFEQLKDKDTAKIVYRKLIADYPKSEQAGSAQNHLNALK